jgi:PIN domain
VHIFAPDTNFFLQCHPADKIDWKQVTQAPAVVLLVVREVRKELDRLKSGGNQRRAKRARAASGLLRRLSTEGLQEIELRATGPRVTLRTAQRPAASALPADYLVETSDDRIVAEVFAAQGAAEDGVTFLSHDSVPLEDAAGLGLPTQVVPEAWLLEPEPSELERELGDMKRRVKALEGRIPHIVVDFSTDAEDNLRLQSPYFPPLSQVFIDAAMREVRRKHPPAVPPDDYTHLTWNVAQMIQAEESRWSRYVEDHSKWLTKVESALNDAWVFFNDDPRAMRLDFSLSNRGHAGAENLIVRIEPRGDFHLVDDDALEEEHSPPWYFPPPPGAPRPRDLLGLSSFDYLTRGLPLHPHDYVLQNLRTPVMARDRHAVYWEYEGGRNATHLEGQCVDFRHGLRPDKFELLLERDAIGDEPIRGAIDILVSAGNLPEPMRVTYPVVIETEGRDMEALIRDLLKRELQIDV